MPKAEEKKFETQLARLQNVVDKLEAGEASLEESLVLFKEGQELVKDCRERLAAARHAVEVFSQDGVVPFEPDADPKDDDER